MDSTKERAEYVRPQRAEAVVVDLSSLFF